MDKVQINDKLYSIFNKFIPEAKLNKLWEKELDSPLTGEIWNFSSVDMVYLFLEVEKPFNLKLDTSKILDYEFNSVNKILCLLNIYLK